MSTSSFPCCINHLRLVHASLAECIWGYFFMDCLCDICGELCRTSVQVVPDSWLSLSDSLSHWCHIPSVKQAWVDMWDRRRRAWAQLHCSDILYVPSTLLLPRIFLAPKQKPGLQQTTHGSPEQSLWLSVLITSLMSALCLTHFYTLSLTPFPWLCGSVALFQNLVSHLTV